MPLRYLRHASAVYISQHQVREGWNHATTSYAGAPVLAAGAGFTRQSKSAESVHVLAEHLSNEEYFATAEASRRNAERGVQKLRVMSMRKSYASFKAACVRVGLKAIRWGDYLLEVSSKAYEKMTVLNCVCVLPDLDLREQGHFSGVLGPAAPPAVAARLLCEAHQRPRPARRRHVP